MHTLTRPRRFWIYDSLPWRTNFQELPSSLEHVHVQRGQQGRNTNLPSYTFGMGNVKEEKKGRSDLPTHTFGMRDVKDERSNMTYIPLGASSALSLLGSLDLYWKSQLLVDYSKDLHTCMILDDHLHKEGYLVHEGVIYNHGRIFLSRASKLKEKLLQRAYKEFFFSHMYSMRIYNIIMRSFDWEGLKEELVEP